MMKPKSSKNNKVLHIRLGKIN